MATKDSIIKIYMGDLANYISDCDGIADNLNDYGGIGCDYYEEIKKLKDLLNNMSLIVSDLTKTYDKLGSYYETK